MPAMERDKPHTVRPVSNLFAHCRSWVPVAIFLQLRKSEVAVIFMNVVFFRLHLWQVGTR